MFLFDIETYHGYNLGRHSFPRFVHLAACGEVDRIKRCVLSGWAPPARASRNGLFDRLDGIKTCASLVPRKFKKSAITAGITRAAGRTGVVRTPGYLFYVIRRVVKSRETRAAFVAGPGEAVFPGRLRKPDADDRSPARKVGGGTRPLVQDLQRPRQSIRRTGEEPVNRPRLPIFRHA